MLVMNIELGKKETGMASSRHKPNICMVGQWKTKKRNSSRSGGPSIKLRSNKKQEY
jgi:hypothetical protein